ncbi:MAG TPA: hypothetical protein PK854_06590 [Oscillospiraceae bacterium]|nr:hypothetical protein [Oscillospiraceae bacterium]HPS34914.1 hypothetical protein [Oscillospiraceae bacterium]
MKMSLHLIMKKVFIFVVLFAVVILSGCSKVSVSKVSEASKASAVSNNSRVSSVRSTLSSPSSGVSLTNENSFEVNLMTTTDWQAFEDAGSSGKKAFALSFPDNWIRDAEGASTFHDKNTGIKVFEAVAVVKLSAGFDFTGSFLKKNFEDSLAGTSVIGEIKIGKLATSNGEKTYAMVIQSVVPEGGGEIRIDRWYPYFCVIVDGDYAYSMQFYSLADPTSGSNGSALFLDILKTYKGIS